MENEISEKPRKLYHEIKEELQSVAAATLVTILCLGAALGFDYLCKRYDINIGASSNAAQHRVYEQPSHLENITATPEHNIPE